MSTVGLTKAMRGALECVRDFGCLPDKADRCGKRLIDAHLATPINPGEWIILPRGHAALAAPRMTQAELETLENCEDDLYVTIRMPSGHEWRTLGHLRDAGFVSPLGFSITPAGRTALNNVRAAMGSPDWKEGL